VGRGVGLSTGERHRRPRPSVAGCRASLRYCGDHGDALEQEQRHALTASALRSLRDLLEQLERTAGAISIAGRSPPSSSAAESIASGSIGQPSDDGIDRDHDREEPIEDEPVLLAVCRGVVRARERAP
jgi:rhodanese-related sulfurtransferase